MPLKLDFPKGNVQRLEEARVGIWTNIRLVSLTSINLRQRLQNFLFLCYNEPSQISLMIPRKLRSSSNTYLGCFVAYVFAFTLF